LAQAQRLTDRCDMPLERLATLLARADFLMASGAAAEATVALSEARTIAERLAVAPALERAAAIEARLAAPAESDRTAGAGATRRLQAVGLSPREVEVIQLVARGLTDAEVGTRLFISPRTVARHLQSVYNKLGVNSRTAAAAFAFEHGLV
jgi:DNA-binding NarL/FixJ family response regulator